MFFMMGITDGRKDFDFVQTMICDACGKYGRYQVFMTYTVLSLFSFRALSGTNIIMCRPVVAGHYMNWIRRSGKRSPAESRLRSCRST